MGNRTHSSNSFRADVLCQVIWAFHENTNGDSSPKDLPAKIKPPRCSFRVGCLSTRSPHRPNAIGLSVVQVVSIGNDFIEVSGLDMVDGTPVLDGKYSYICDGMPINCFFFSVKPYIPYDIIPFDKPIPMLSWARAGESATQLKCPSWVYEADIPFRKVVFPQEAENAILFALDVRARSGRSKSAYYASSCAEELKCLIEQVIILELQ